MSLPTGMPVFDCVEVRFKNGRKDFYRNGENLTLSIGDIVATECSPGHDIGIVTLTGELVKVQMKKKGVDYKTAPVLKLYRKASQKDIDIWQAAREREEPMKVRARELAIALNLEMKISDIEFQGDASKATFYYTANDRVDFRQLIKDYAKEFNIRIEMKQVGFRQEASRLGGVGSCGRELCCSTWLTDFRSVNTSAARYQQLSLNPQKLAGQCGKLKCCLNYELDTYMDALKDFPEFDTKIQTEKGIAICQKQDIFKGLMWYAYPENFAQWHVLKVEQVKEIIAENKKGNRVTAIEDYALDLTPETGPDFTNSMGQESLTRFDQPKKKKRPKKRTDKEADASGTAKSNSRSNERNTGERTPNKSVNKPNNKGPRQPQSKDANKPQNQDRAQNATKEPKAEGQVADVKTNPNRNKKRPNKPQNQDRTQNPNKEAKAEGQVAEKTERRDRPQRNDRPKNENRSEQKSEVRKERPSEQGQDNKREPQGEQKNNAEGGRPKNRRPNNRPKNQDKGKSNENAN